MAQSRQKAARAARKDVSAVGETPGLEVAGTAERILDAAEYLFGVMTFDGVSMRAISGRANVNLGLLYYHFRTKDAIFEQVFARRAKLLSDLRRDRLAALRAAGPPDVEELIDAFMGPMFEMMASQDAGWRSYVLLLTQIGQTNRWLNLLGQHFDDTARMFITALQAALPEVDEKDVVYGFNFVLITMLHAVGQNQRLDALSEGLLHADDLKASYAKLMVFVCSGLRGYGATRTSPPSRPEKPRTSTRTRPGV